jgi:hypothetical protein
VLPLHAVQGSAVPCFWLGNRTCKQTGVFACLLACLFVLGCGCKGIYSAPSSFWLGSAGWWCILAFSAWLTRWLPACFVIAAICPIVLVLSAFAWVGFSALVVFVPVPFLGFSRPAGGSSSRLVPLVPFLFLFLFLLPSVWVLVVAVFLLWFSNFYFGGSALWWWRVWWCGVVFSSSFLFPS